MLKRFNKRSGNRYTILSIIMIIFMMYFLKIALGRSGEGNYPQNVYYENNKYEYSQTIKESSFVFVRKYGVNYEGHVLLLKRGENKEAVPSKVYIFIGWKKYKEYQLVQ